MSLVSIGAVGAGKKLTTSTISISRAYAGVAGGWSRSRPIKKNKRSRDTGQERGSNR